MSFDLQRPVIPDFVGDDEEIKGYIDGLKLKLLGFRDRKFFVRGLNRDVGFDWLVGELRSVVVSRDAVRALADVFTNFPGELELVHDELVWQMKRIVAIAEGYASLVATLDEFIDEQSRYVADQDSLIGELRSQLAVLKSVDDSSSSFEDDVVGQPVSPVESVVKPKSGYVSKRDL